MTQRRTLRSIISNVPDDDTRGCCRICFGTCNPSYGATCYKCGRLWPSQYPDFASSCDLIVPCTVARSPGEWYNTVWNYKQGAYERLGPRLSAVLDGWLKANKHHVKQALGGSPDVVTVVPSSTREMPTALYRVVENTVLGPMLIDAIRFLDGAPRPHHRALRPDSLETTADVVDAKVIIIEDTWVSGATPLSAAMAVRRDGAERIALIPIARMAEQSPMTDEYQNAAEPPWRHDHYPRSP